MAKNPLVQAEPEADSQLGVMGVLAERRAKIEALLDSAQWDISREHRTDLEMQLRRLSRYESVVKAGYEPTTPPTAWFVGFMRAVPRSVSNRREWFPGRRTPDRWVNQPERLVFTAPVPSDVMEKYRQAVPVFGEENLRVYSPTINDFAADMRPLPVDPVIIGRLDWNPQEGEKPTYYEIARWDVDKDLAELYKSLL